MKNIFKEVDRYIANEDWESVMCWAESNHDTTDELTAEKVMECYELCLDLFPEASLNLGTFYYNGVFVEQDFKKAFELYKTAADAGVIRAICNCAYCFYYGRHQEIDYAEAFKYFNKGALLFDDPNCLYKLGDMYLNGYYVEKNEKYAFMLYKRAYNECNEEDDYCYPDIQFRLGKCLLRGIGTDQDAQKANEFLCLALFRFYQRLMYDPFVKGLIKSTKKLLAEAQEILDNEAV